MNMKKLILAASLATALSTAAFSASATDYTATFNDGDASIFSKVTGTKFDDIFKFTVTGSYDLGSSAISGVIKRVDTVSFTSFDLYSSATNQILAYGTISGSSASIDYSTLSTGSYYIEATGNVIGGKGSYGGTISITAVPEPESYAMLLAGLGLMGTIARRRSKSKAV